ncbi:hypothetical protein [Streptomyces sp. AK02-01A]|uniref:hypothetical protein n=1 Tax=Streptomyces sp. AK02-01A TaxID=3028648 RepID=UPI0029BAFA96|nr:hypothetical protein [Streptomyces sp. AK02-01A]MDX3852139.1 hypothetical protein [Streptomyces sp. AK02-01A]
MDLSEKVPRAWTLIGGQMVLLHGLEHGRTPPAASLDLDVLADVVSTIKGKLHLAFLLSLPTNPIVLRSEVTSNDRKKLALAKALLEADHAAWRELRDADAQADGLAMYRFLSSPN